MRLRRSPAPLAFAALAITSLLSGGAEAGPVRVTDTKAVIIPDPNFRYIFTLALDPDSRIDGSLDPAISDFITFYDVDGMAIEPTSPGIDGYLFGTNSQPNNWALASGPDTTLGRNPAGAPTPFFDDPNILNITWRFIAPDEDIVNPPGAPPLIIVDDRGVSEFSLQAIVDAPPLFLWYGSQTTRPDGTKEFFYGKAFFVVPEPGTLVMVSAAGVAGMLVLLRRRMGPRVAG